MVSEMSKSLNNITKDDAKNQVTIDAAPNREPLRYQALNEQIHELLRDGHKNIKLLNVVGQRFIGAAVSGDIKLEIHGTPGNDLGIFMDGPTIEVFGNVEDHCGNTMNSGTIIVHGSARDVAGLSARGGNIFVRGDGGYRCGVHMKQYMHMRPQIVFGGEVREFFGEYMAGGLIVLLGLDIKSDGSFEKISNNGPIVGHSLATGIHGGKILIAREIDEIPKVYMGRATKIQALDDSDCKDLDAILDQYCPIFKLDKEKILNMPFCKVTAISSRPFATGSHYCSKSL
ncbi:MAG: hypothetical protein ACFFCS_02130 [Candidatus Hodarchaeota archaeon]